METTSILNQAKILIIDDDPIHTKSLEARLKKRGFTVFTLPGANNCLKVIIEENIDLLILDMVMPEITGIEALNLIRKKYSKFELPIIMVTSESEGENISLQQSRSHPSSFSRPPVSQSR